MSTRNTPTVIKRHSPFTRFWHWINFACLVVLLMSGLQIFNAHPSLYWGNDSHFDTPALSIGAIRTAEGELRGVTRLGGYRFDTTGILGVSGPDADRDIQAFPAWSTLPSPRWLAMGRQWHFLAAWIFAPMLIFYLLYLIIGGQLRRRLLPRPEEWRQFSQILIDHIRLRFPRGEEARHYNLLQKLTYLLILFIVAPLVVLTGLTMSPTVDAAWPWLLDLFGGRQTARTLHFLCAGTLLAFFMVHIVLVLVSGFFNNMRSMISGRFTLPPEKEPRDDASH